MSEDANDYHWRNSMRPARFFTFDARSVVGIAFWGVHATRYTFGLAIVIIIFFWFAERAGYEFNAVLRRIRSAITGPKRPATAQSTTRRLKDYGK